MVSKRQEERSKKFKALKRKQKKLRRKQRGEIEVRQAQVKGDQVEVIEEDLEEFLQANSLPPEIEAAFRKFNGETKPAPQDFADWEPSLETQPPSQPLISKKKLKKLSRPSIFQLKQTVKKPEVVEWVDTTAQDPYFLVYLKSYRNAVTVPKHWSHKRKFLQLKRATEKMPFALPDFIEATGIGKIRAQMREREAGKLLKQRMRERMNPKLGKLDIDYQVLHDAFFKYQKRPKMTIIGDTYHEGKENELKMRIHKPGALSEELKMALGMPEGCPPPWLINMQRFGPPPAYPHLRIPGLNAPVPEGTYYLGWGKPGMEGVYGATSEVNSRFVEEEEYSRPHWGELVEEESEEETESEEEDPSEFIRGTAFAGFSDLTPLLGESVPMVKGVESVVGYQTPSPVELRK